MKPLKVYACYNKDFAIRRNSSSGAVFYSLAEYVISQRGVVYGVTMSEDLYYAEFIAVTECEKLKKLMGSKYFQAKVGNIFKCVQSHLLEGKLVLFTGTGCQVNGLKRYLGKEYDNLICADVICHGVPSPALWKKYVEYQEQKNFEKLKGVNFRCKDKSWTDFGMKTLFGSAMQGEERTAYISKDKDSYMQMFLRDYCLRPSCYKCDAKKIKMADLTIGDFWGIDKVAPEINDEKGTSLVLIRTTKGIELFERIRKSQIVKEVSYEEGVKENPAEFKSCARPMQRDTFFEDMKKMKFDELEEKYANPIDRSYRSRIKRKIKTLLSVIGWK